MTHESKRRPESDDPCMRHWARPVSISNGGVSQEQETHVYEKYFIPFFLQAFVVQYMGDVHMKAMEASYATILWGVALAVVGFLSHRIIAIALRPHSSRFNGLPRPKVQYSTRRTSHSKLRFR